jgi:hypothetical protein
VLRCPPRGARGRVLRCPPRGARGRVLRCPPRGARRYVGDAGAAAQKGDEMQAEPPTAEREPTAAEFEAKKKNGRLYLHDIWRVVPEFPSAELYDCATDLSKLVNTVGPAVHAAGYLAVDSSYRLNGLDHALHLTESWTDIVREAHTNKVMHVLRRTPENSGPMLMIQRQEHIRGYVDEMSPIALIVACRNELLLLPRNRVPEQAELCRLLVDLASAPAKEAATLPSALYKQQMEALTVMMDALSVPAKSKQQSESPPPLLAPPLDAPPDGAAPLHAADEAAGKLAAKVPVGVPVAQPVQGVLVE